MAKSGPIPRRESDLARPRERKGGKVQPVQKGRLREVTIPEADPDWHPIAKMIWESAQTSGQADYYQDTDYALLYSICEDISVYKDNSRRNGQILSSLYSTLGRLMFTEGDRRSLRLELHADEPEDDAEVHAIEDYKNRLKLVA